MPTNETDRFIKTGENKGKYVALVDDEDYESLNKYRWQVIKDKYTNYARRTEKGVKYLMHRQILELTETEFGDHKDGNGLNNQRNNIRKATPSENTKNKVNCCGISKYLGVYIHTAKIDRILSDGTPKTYFYQWWAAKIVVNKKQKYLGIFSNEDKAAEAYNKNAKKYHGEFARLNIIK